MSTVSIPRLFTLAVVARLLGVSPHTIRSWVKTGRLRPLRICRRLLFEPCEVERFLQASREPVE